MKSKFKIYPEYNLIVILDSKIKHHNHFFNLISSVRKNKLFDPSYNLLYDGHKVNWSKTNAEDITLAIEEMQKDPTILSHCAYIIRNIGQMAYADLMFMKSEQYEVEYFLTIKEACLYLNVPKNVIKF